MAEYISSMQQAFLIYHCTRCGHLLPQGSNSVTCEDTQGCRRRLRGGEFMRETDESTEGTEGEDTGTEPAPTEPTED